MRRIILTSVWVCFCIIWGASMAFAQTGEGRVEVFYFAFRDGSEVYERDYQGNNATFQQLDNCIDSFIFSDNNWHLLLEVFVKEGDVERLQVLNQAIFRAAVVRSQLSRELDIPYDRIAFYIRQSSELTNQVRVSIVEQPMPFQANTDIFYSLSSLSSDISRALSRYKQLPFYDSDDEEKDVFVQTQPADEIDEVESSIEYEFPSISEKQAELIQNTELNPKKPIIAIQNTGNVILKSKLPPGAYPFNIGIKTNLLPWMGVVPFWNLEGGKNKGYSQGAPMYNGALEYYFADRYSLEASFLYAYSSYGGKKDNLWGISVFSLEPRFWLDPDNSFRKFHVGMRAEYGDFDIKNNIPVNYGKTGRFYSVAFKVGYTLPIYRNFLVEAGVSVGYRNMYDGKNYRYDPAEKKNFYEDGFSEGTFVVGLSVSLLYRLGFW